MSQSPLLADSLDLQTILRREDVWRGPRLVAVAGKGVSSGRAELDKKLLGGGWPLRSLIEIEDNAKGFPVWSLFLPAVRQLLLQPGYVFLLAPPAIPYAPALVQQGCDPARLMVVEVEDKSDWLAAALEILRSDCGLLLMAWEPGRRLLYPELRKLQLAASHSSSMLVLMRSSQMARGGSPAALRLALHSDAQGTLVQIRKQRGSYQLGRVRI